MKREIIKTSDGSSTIYIPEWDEQYHSINGAITEAYHVYINAGINEVNKKNINILEIGFGTGLNTLITYIEAEKQGKKIYYQAVENNPVTEEEIKQLNYTSELRTKTYQKKFEAMHSSRWDEDVFLSDNFTLRKQLKDIKHIKDENKFDVIYFDAFSPTIQPELWTKNIFENMFNSLKHGGIIMTYSSKGVVKRAMRDVGFEIERLQGPKGKRHILRGIKK